MSKQKLVAPIAAPGVALLRGINVGGNRLLPMAGLRELASGLGLAAVRTYLQSGNLIFTAPPSAAALDATAAALEAAIAARFGFAVPVIARSAAAWAGHAAGSPFVDAERERPNLLHLILSQRPPRADAVALLRSRAAAGERVELRGDGLWIDYVGGVARSKLSPALLDRAVGSTVTARNWKTVRALAELLAA